MSSDRLAPMTVQHASAIGEMTPALSAIRHKRLNGRCPDGERCRLPVACSEQCSRLESAAIADTLRAQAAIAAGRQPDTTPDIERTHEEGEPMDPPLPETAPEPESPAIDAAITICKVSGCAKPAVATMGRYAKLCLEHRGTAPVATTPKRRAKRTRRAVTNGAGKLTAGTLVKLARDLVTVSDELADLEHQVTAKQGERDKITAQLAKAAAKT